MRILGISAFYHDSAAALLVDGRIVAAAQEERFTRKKQDARFPVHAIGYCLAEGRHHARRRRLRRVLREAVPEVRAAARDLCRASRRAASSPSRWRSRSGSAKSCSRRTCIRRELQKLAPDFDWQEPAAVHRASRQPRGERVLCLAVPGGGGADDGRRRRMVHDLGRGRPRQRAHAHSRSCISRIRSGCSIPPSPITPASRSIPASTS